MWRELGFDLFGRLFQNNIGRFIFPKTRKRFHYKERLKFIVYGFQDAVAYHKTCSLINVIGIANKGKANTPSSFYLENANLLRDWTFSFQGRIETTYLSYTSKLFEEFELILVKVHNIFREFSRQLNEDLISELKSNGSGYPTFKRIYNKTIDEFEKLSQEASKEFSEIKKCTMLALPEL